MGMGKKKRRLSADDKAARRQRRLEYQTIFVGGKMKRVRRTPTIDGVSIEEFVRANADPVFLHQEGLWELLEPEEVEDELEDPFSSDARSPES
jgi:hypothetical protein